MSEHTMSLLYTISTYATYNTNLPYVLGASCKIIAKIEKAEPSLSSQWRGQRLALNIKNASIVPWPLQF